MIAVVGISTFRGSAESNYLDSFGFNFRGFPNQHLKDSHVLPGTHHAFVIRRTSSCSPSRTALTR
jgi:hypothetical protein